MVIEVGSYCPCSRAGLNGRQVSTQYNFSYSPFPWRPAAQVGLTLLLLASGAQRLTYWAEMLGNNTREVEEIDVALGRWLAANTPPDALIAVDDIGAITFLSQDQLTLSAVTAQVTADLCAACLVCVRSCPYNVPRINEDGVSQIDEALCQGCGVCAAECPAKAIELNWYEDNQLMSKIDSLLEGAR